MQDYTNGRLRYHTPRPPQPQFSTTLGSQARNSSFHHAFSPELLEPFQYSQEEAIYPLNEPQLNEIDEQSRSVDPYGNVDCGSQSSTNHSTEGPTYMPRINGAQGYMPQRSPFSQEIDLAEMPQEDDVLQTGGHFRAVDSAFRQQGNHIGAASALHLRDNGYHISSRESSTTLPLGPKRRRVDHASRDLQEICRIGRRSSGEYHSHLEISNPGITQTPSISGSFTSHTNTGGRQVDPLEQTTADGINPPVVSPVDGGVLDWSSGNERIDLAAFYRSSFVDSGLPNDATSRAQNSHIGPSVSEPRRNSQSPYQRFAQYHRDPALQPQLQPRAQVGRRGTRDSPSLALDPSVMSYGMQSLDNDEFARIAQELAKGIQADNPQAGNPEMYLSPNWTPSHKASSETYYDDGSDLSDN